MGRALARKFFGIATLVCLLIVISFHGKGGTYDDGVIWNKASFGLNTSPWITINYNIRQDDGTILDDLNFYPFSWSGLTFVIGVVCFVVYYNLREKPFLAENSEQEPENPDTSSPPPPPPVS